ncbi:MAG: glycosyltransferase [Elusimicrobia bacterium]|nr:glycosyltransferase [Elusimicrobiota bacterium]
MNLTPAVILVALSVAFGLIPLFLTARFRKQVKVLGNILYPRPRGRVAVILPCKGIDPGFRDNLRAFFDQDYPSLELVFSVATADDPACPEIDAAIEENAGRVKAYRIVAGIENVRAQKITNLLRAVEFVGKSADILVFADSDLRPDSGFVRRLVAPLVYSQVGATTGYQWYAPPTPTLGSMLRSVWNAGALTFIADSRRNFCSGAATALRRGVFERAHIAQAWDRTLSDDLTLTLEVRALGMETMFVPSCVCVTHESSTLAQTVEYTNRQSVISRVYMPSLWWSAAIGHSIGCFFMLVGLTNLLMWCVHGGAASLLGSACLLMVPLQWVNALWLLGAVREMLPQLSDPLARLKWHYMFAASLAPFLSLTNTINSLFTNRITWRGIQYEMRSPWETVILPSVQPTAKEAPILLKK